ncbi:MAG: hypothetical protein AB1447_08975, partial [Bacillota bacterium]
IGHITFDEKLTGKRSAGNPHAAFDEAGAGNGLHSTAPDLDPTRGGWATEWWPIYPEVGGQ